MPPDPFPPLQTARLHLRCVRPEDAAAMSALMTPGVSQWLGAWPVPFTLAMAEARIAALREQAAAGNALPYAVTEAGGLAGWAMVSRDKADRRHGILSYWLGEPHQGRGLMREAAPPVVAAGFATLDLDAIEATAHHGNAGSLAVMRACGLRLVGERLIYAAARDREEPCLAYAVSRDCPLEARRVWNAATPEPP